MKLLECWQHSCVGLDVSVDMALFEQLVSSYSEPSRHYHTLQHLEECFSYFDLVKDEADTPEAIAMALWFHDGVYDVKGQQNEQLSADWAVKALSVLDMAESMIEKIVQLILATQHDRLPVEQDAKLMVDIDLAILGSKPERFAQYEQQIKAEYAWVPNCTFRRKRKVVLKGFLERDVIFQSATLRSLLEKQARENLSAILAKY